MKSRTLISTCLALSLSALGASPPTSDARTGFALDLYRDVARDAVKNVAVSPPALGVERAPYDLDIASALWVDRTVEIDDALRDRVRRELGARIFRTNLTKNPGFSVSLINSWVRKTTRHHVSYVADQSDLSSKSRVLTSAVYLEALWSPDVRTSGSASRAFRLADGTSAQVDTMTLAGNLRHVVDRQHAVDVLELPFADDRLALMVVLPQAGSRLAGLERQLTPQLLAQWRSALAPTRASVSLPRFRVETRVDTAKAMKRSGFAAGGLSLDAVLQTTVIDVSDKGAQPAADNAAPAARIDVDRPFLFVVRDRTTGLVLAVGRVQDPQSRSAPRPSYVEASRRKGTLAEQERANRAGVEEIHAHYDALAAEARRFSTAEKKVDEGLVWETRMHAATDVAPGIPSTNSLIEYDAQGFTRVTVRGDISEDLLARASALGARVFSQYRGHASMRIPISSILALAAHPDVELIYPHSDL